MIAKNIKLTIVYMLILVAGLGMGTVAPKIVDALKPGYSEGNFAAYYPDSRTKVIVYGTATCPYCASTRDYLKAKKIAFVDVNISDSEVGRKQFVELGGKYVPMILVGNRRIVGLRMNVLEDALDAANVTSRN